MLDIGIHGGIPAAEYHKDPCERPSLSASIASILINLTPYHAWCAHPRLNPRWKPDADEKFAPGAVVHELLLGKGPGFYVVNEDSWRTKESKAHREAAIKHGLVPILEHQYMECSDIKENIKKKWPQCPLFDSDARYETVLVWNRDGVLCRGMLDCISRGTVWDVKTTRGGLSDSSIARTIATFDYDLQAATYLSAAELLGVVPPSMRAFRWLFVEMSYPYEFRVIKPDSTMLEIGRRKLDIAAGIWNRSLLAGRWPGYPRCSEEIPYPSWAEAQWAAAEACYSNDGNAATNAGSYDIGDTAL